MLFVYILGIISAGLLVSRTGSSVLPPCPSFWEFFGDACFLFMEPATWADARAACLNLDSEMVVPYSAQENNFVAEMARVRTIDRTWIDCSYKQTSKRWECEGEANEVGAFSNWDPSYNQPGLCGYVWGKVQEDWFGKWYNRSCDNMFPTVCVKRPQVIPSTTEGTASTNVDGRPVTGGRPCRPRPRYLRFAMTENPLPLNSCLVDHVINEFVITSIPSCAFACIREPRCRSINIKITEEGGQKVCQLNDSTDPAKIQQTDSVCLHYTMFSE